MRDIYSRYQREREYVIDFLTFEYKKGRYEGRGVLQWHPETGAYIEAPVTRVGEPLRSFGIGLVGILRNADYATVRTRCLGGLGERRNDIAFVGCVALVDRVDVLIQNF